VKSRTIIIAEAGVNHNGDLAIAKKLVDEAANAGADYVKFQTFTAEKLVSKRAAKASYQSRNSGDQDQSQLAMLKSLEMSDDMHRQLIEYCKSKNIHFLSTAFDLESLDYLEGLDLDLYKIPSGGITDRPYLEKVGSMGKPIILSTGMSTMEEIEKALQILQEAGTKKSDLTVLHCNTEYPTPMQDVHLLAMRTIADSLDVQVGYSDHTEGIEVALAAVALGAVVMEKHFTLDKQMEGPDHKASLDPNELKALVRGIRNLEQALGSKDKKPSPSELKNISAARKSIHLASAVSKGHTFTVDDLVMKRPGDGITPMKYHEIVGRLAGKDLEADHKISWEDLL